MEACITPQMKTPPVRASVAAANEVDGWDAFFLYLAFTLLTLHALKL